MKMSEYQLEQFNQYLSNAKKNDEISLLLSEGEDRMQSLYDLCSDYSHVSINSEKIQTDKLSLACLPSENDIDLSGWWIFWPEVVFDDDRTARGMSVKVFVYER